MCVSYTPGLKLMVDINKLLLKLKYVKTRKNTHVQREREKYEVIKLYEKTNRQKTQIRIKHKRKLTTLQICMYTYLIGNNQSKID